jgi:hypothetical protein
VSALEQRRFSQDTIRRYIRGADRLCRWLNDQGVALIEANQNHIKRYVLQHARLPDIRYTQGRLSQGALSVPLIAKVLCEQGILCGSAPVSKADAWLARFDDHLVRVDGMSRYYSRDQLCPLRAAASTIASHERSGLDGTECAAHPRFRAP